MKHKLQSKKGAVTVLVLLFMVVILGFTALAVDLGMSYHEKISLQNAVDNSIYAAGSEVPCTNTTTGKKIVTDLFETYMDANGFSPSDLTISYEWETSGSYAYSVRATASKEVQYLFAGVLGLRSGTVSATAKITCKPVTSTLKAISIYIDQTSFEKQVNLNTVKPGESFTITINSSGASASSGGTYGIIRIVPSGEESLYTKYDSNIFTSSSVKGDPIFFRYGYWRRTESGEKIGISVGETRSIENTSEIYSNAYTGMTNRINDCKSQCESGCCAENHTYDCPRIALLPVVTSTTSSTSSTSYSDVGRGSKSGGGGGGGGGGSSSTGTATIQYFVAIYIESVKKSGSTTTITACYLDDYRETSDVDSDSVTAAVNQYMVCSTFMEP